AFEVLAECRTAVRHRQEHNKNPYKPGNGFALHPRSFGNRRRSRTFQAIVPNLTRQTLAAQSLVRRGCDESALKRVQNLGTRSCVYGGTGEVVMRRWIFRIVLLLLVVFVLACGTFWALEIFPLHGSHPPLKLAKCTLAIQHAKIYTSPTAAPIEDGTVLIRDG